MRRAAWRKTIPALPALLELYADPLSVWSAEVAARVEVELRQQLRGHLGGYGLPVLPKEAAAVVLPAGVTGPDALYAALQNAVCVQMVAAFAAALEACSHALEPMLEQTKNIQAHLRKFAQDPQGLSRALCERTQISHISPDQTSTVIA